MTENTPNEIPFLHKLSGFRDYFVASLLAAAVVVFFGLYLAIRRGYLFDVPSTVDPLYIPNQVLASAAAFLLGFTFLIGPVTRYFNRWDYFLAYRKEIGVVACFLAVVHGIISYYFLPLKFPQEWINLASLEFGAGLIGVLMLVFLFILSFKRVIALLEGKTWWQWQRWGLRIVILMTLIHVYVLKWDSWVYWFSTPHGGKVTADLAHPDLPTLGLLTLLFITWVTILRTYESVFLFQDFGLTPKEISMNETLHFRGRRFFVFSLFVLTILYILVITRWLV